MMTPQGFAQAMQLAGVEDPGQENLLRLMCSSAVSGLRARLQPGLQPEDCKADFVAAASLYALAALSEVDPVVNIQQIQVGDVTLRPGGSSAAARCLRKQAELIMAPYLESGYAFRRV
jgi:hypothetical protein